MLSKKTEQKKGEKMKKFIEIGMIDKWPLKYENITNAEIRTNTQRLESSMQIVITSL